MPGSATLRSTVPSGSSSPAPATVAPTVISEPSAEYFTALSTRLASADTSWRRSPWMITPVGTSRRISMPAWAGAEPSRSSASATKAATSTSSNSASSPNSMLLSSSRSSTVRPSRSVSAIIRVARRSTTAGSGSSITVSASSPTAPMGVLSSWEMLATKSRRTVSMRRCRVRSSTIATAPSTWAAPASPAEPAAPGSSSDRTRNGRATTRNEPTGGPNTSTSRRTDRPASASARSSSIAAATSTWESRASNMARATRLR